MGGLARWGLVGVLVLGSAAAATADAPRGRTGTHGEQPRGRTVDACGALVAKAGGGTWSCTFADDFDGRALDRRRWHAQSDFRSGTPGAPLSCAIDSPETIRVAGGELRLTVREARGGLTCGGHHATHAGASISTYRLFSQRYGRFEARYSAAESAGPGLQESFWLWPDDRHSDGTVWPAAGEIDVAETYSQHPDLAIPFLHYTAWDNGGPQPGVNTAWDCLAPRGEFHTYTLTWTPESIRIDVDGQECLTNTSGDPAFDKPYIVALTAGLGAGENTLREGGSVPATMRVDYVRVWR